MKTHNIQWVLLVESLRPRKVTLVAFHLLRIVAVSCVDRIIARNVTRLYETGPRREVTSALTAVLAASVVK